MRLTICDDEPAELARIRTLAEEYLRRRSLDICLACFSSAAELLDYDRRHGQGEVYLLDVLMPDMNGIELGRVLHSRRPKTAIIYLTTSRDFYPEAFSVRAFSYLVKPVGEEALFRDLDECFSYLIPAERTRMRITVKTADGITPVELSRINAVEYSNHRLIFHLKNGGQLQSLYRREPFNQMAGEFLDTGRFVRCAEGYLVNMTNIQAITPSGFRMSDKTEYPITRKYASAKKQFIDFEAES